MPLRPPVLSLADHRRGPARVRRNPERPQQNQMLAWWRAATAEELVKRAAELGAPKPLLVLAACACARAVLPYTRPQDRAVCEYAIETAERWTRGEATVLECREAAKVAAERATEAGAEAGAATAAGAGAAAARTAWAAGAAGAAGAARAARTAARAAPALADLALVHNAARSVLTFDTMVALELRAAVLAKSPDERLEAQWNEALESGALQDILDRWARVSGSGHEDERELLNKLAANAKAITEETVVYVPGEDE